jgi:prolyl oligopeptidase
MILRSVIALLLLFIFSCNTKQQFYEYPKIKANPAVEKLFGVELLDRYRVLENENDTAVARWFDRQQLFYNKTISQIPGRDSLKSEIAKYIYSSNIRGMLPRSAPGKTFYGRTFMDENNDVILFYDSLEQKEITVINTKTFESPGVEYYVQFFEPSYDANYLLFGLGSDDEKVTMFLYDVRNRKLTDERFERAIQALPNWLPDNSGFLYNQLKEISSEEDKGKAFEGSIVKLHKIGTQPKNDKAIIGQNLGSKISFQNIDAPIIWTHPKSGKVLLEVYHGETNYISRTFVTEIEELKKNPEDIDWKQITSEKDIITYTSLNEKSVFYLDFTKNSNGVLVRASIDKPATKEEILQGRDIVLQELFQNNESIFVKYLKNGLTKLFEIKLDDWKVSEVNLPINGTITFSRMYRKFDNSNQLFLGIEGWTNEYGIYNYNKGKFRLTIIRPPGPFAQPKFLTSKHIEVKSEDGELIPLSLVYDERIKLDGKNPTILTAYGSFGDVITPFYDPYNLAWFKRGGILAIAHVRGGGEKGEYWYKEGFKAKKMNSWKDFITCSNYLIQQKYTSPEKLAAYGRSAGAIPVGRAIEEAPENFKAAVIGVGLLNSVRFENTSNTINISEFGTSKDSLEFQHLLKMDVYHNINKGKKYPSILFTAGLKDNRVVAWQPAKAVAKFQEACEGDENIILFRISGQGHFNSSNTEDEISERFAFLFWQLGLQEFQIK